MSEVYVMVTICSRKNMPRFVDCYKDYNVEAANISLGRGTASSDVLDLLGLEDDEKGIHMARRSIPSLSCAVLTLSAMLLMINPS